jgi:hypothetical protein
MNDKKPHFLTQEEYEKQLKEEKKVENKHFIKEYILSRYLLTITIPFFVAGISLLISISSIVYDIKLSIISFFIFLISVSISNTSQKNKDKIDEIEKNNK